MTPAEAIAHVRDWACTVPGDHWHAVADTLEAAIPPGTVVDLGVWEASRGLTILTEPGADWVPLFSDSVPEAKVRDAVKLKPGKRYQVHVVVKEVGDG